eukprot:scaffold70131_cov66-Cyclotella_meneghiniana.AAC.13
MKIVANLRSLSAAHPSTWLHRSRYQSSLRKSRLIVPRAIALLTSSPMLAGKTTQLKQMYLVEQEATQAES